MQTVKMVVTGPFSAGKTQFIQAVSEIDAVATKRKISSDEKRSVKSATMVAMDFGRITSQHLSSSGLVLVRKKVRKYALPSRYSQRFKK